MRLFNNKLIIIVLAASEGFAECVKLLLSLGGNIEAQDHEGARPLHIAISSNHLEVVELLLASGKLCFLCKFQSISTNSDIFNLLKIHLI